MSKRDRANNYIESKTDAFGECDADSGLWLVKYEIDGNTITWDSTLEQVSSADATGCNVAVIQAGKIWTRDDCFIDTELIKEMIAFYDAIYTLSPLEKAKEYIESLEGSRRESMWIDEDAKHSLRVGYQDGSITSNSFVFHQDSGEIRIHSGRCEPSVRLDREGGIIFLCASHLDVNDLQELINFWKAIYGDGEGGCEQ